MLIKGLGLAMAAMLVSGAAQAGAPLTRYLNEMMDCTCSPTMAVAAADLLRRAPPLVRQHALNDSDFIGGKYTVLYEIAPLSAPSPQCPVGSRLAGGANPNFPYIDINGPFYL